MSDSRFAEWRKEMTNSQHTPGPWEARTIPNPLGESTHIRAADNSIVARLEGANGKANGHLIAGAPTLLEKAERFLEVIDNITTEDFSKGAERPEREALRLAIAHAKGESTANTPGSYFVFGSHNSEIVPPGPALPLEKSE